MSKPKRRSPIKHRVGEHSRKGRTIKEFTRGKGERKVRVISQKKRQIKKGSLIVNQQHGIGTLNEIKRYEDIPDRVHWTEKYSEGTLFAFVDWKEGGSSYLPLSEIEKLSSSELKMFERRRNKVKLEFTRDLVRQDKLATKFFSHESDIKHLDSILKSGLDPAKMKKGFRYFPGKFVMFTSAKHLKDLSKGSGGKGDPKNIYIVFKPTGAEKSVLGEMLTTEKGRSVLIEQRPDWIERIMDWSYSKKSISPDQFIIIYDNKGNVLWRK